MALTQVSSSMFGNAGNELGTRNFIINGAFDIWQRGTSFTSTYFYTADRWQGTRYASGNYNVSRQSSGLTGFDYCIRCQRPSGDTGGTSYFLNQALESVISRKLAGQTVTFSAWVRVGSNYSGAVQMATTYHTDGSSTDNGMYYFNFKTAASQTTNSNTLPATTAWQRYTLTTTIPANVQQVAVAFGNINASGTAGANDYFEVTGVQLEIGSSATPFEMRPYALELSLCKRYYENIYWSVNGYFGQWTGVEFFGGQFNYEVEKRATPSISNFTNSGYWVAAGQQAFSAQTSHSFTVANANTKSAMFRSNRPVGNTSPTVGGMYMWEGNPTIPVSAEL